jgi:peptide-methionine (S)-S-oxide reductase
MMLAALFQNIQRLALARLACSAGVALALSFGGGTLAQTASPSAVAPTVPTPKLSKAIFAGGCFWCVEADFDKVPGVVSTTSGYSGGKLANPTYQQVSSGATGHAEVVQVVFDPDKVSYKILVDYFWRTIDPTTRDQQFCDMGSPYRSAIYPLDADQLRIAKASLADLQKSKPFKQPVVTEIALAGAFYPAEDYHQDYHLKNPLRYNYYKSGCGRVARLTELWGDLAGKLPK